MKKLLFLLCFFTSQVYADEVRCYADARLIYQHHVHAVSYDGDFLSFTENDTGKIVISPLPCVVKIELED